MNTYLVLIIVIISLLSNKTDRPLLLSVSTIYLIQLTQTDYLSAFIADFVVLYIAKNEKTELSFKIAAISLCFMLSHIFGFIIYNLYIEPSSYNSLLSCLYFILIYEITTKGGLWDGLKRLANAYRNDIVCRARLFMDLLKG